MQSEIRRTDADRHARSTATRRTGGSNIAFSGWAFFVRSARLLPLDFQSSALPLSYLDVTGQEWDSNPRPLVGKTTDRAAAYRVRNAAAPWGVETRIRSDTFGLSPCLPFRARCFVLKAQYVKNVSVPGEGFEPSCSSLWARRDHQFRQPGSAWSGDLRRPAHAGLQPAAEVPFPDRYRSEAANPALSGRVRCGGCVVTASHRTPVLSCIKLFPLAIP